MIQVIILVLVFMFIKSDDIPNNQRVHVELIEVSNDYFSLDENLNLPTKMRSDAHFRQVNNVVHAGLCAYCVAFAGWWSCADVHRFRRVVVVC